MFKGTFGAKKKEETYQAPASGAWGGGSFGANVNVAYDDAPAAATPPQGLWSQAAATTPAQREAAYQGGVAVMNNPLARSIAADMAASQVRRPDVERGFEGGGGDLSSREAELARREAELRRREQGGAAPPQGMEKKRNWPVCCPFMYHDIGSECKPEYRAIVRWGYLSFLFFCVLLFWQWICVTALLGKGRGKNPGQWFLSSIYMLVGIPAGLWLWYKRLYNLGKVGSGYILFLVFYAVHCGFCIWCAVAPPISSSSAVNGAACTGFLSSIDAFKASKVIGVMYIAGAVGWTGEAIFCIVILGLVYKKFRGRS